MRVLGMRVSIIILVFFLALGAFLGGRYWFLEQRVRSPLQEQLAAIPGVEEAELVASSGLWQGAPVDVRIKLARGVDLPQTYGLIQRELAAGLGPNLGDVELLDQRDPVLADALREMQFALEEGIATGAFRQMAREVEEVARRFQVDDLDLNIDRHFVYLSLQRGEAYLYHVVPRGGDGLPVQAAGPSPRGALWVR